MHGPHPTRRYQAEFKVTYADRASETFPNRGFIDVFVAEDVPGLLA